jgi:hypothetical protein
VVEVRSSPTHRSRCRRRRYRCHSQVDERRAWSRGWVNVGERMVGLSSSSRGPEWWRHVRRPHAEVVAIDTATAATHRWTDGARGQRFGPVEGSGRHVAVLVVFRCGCWGSGDERGVRLGVRPGRCTRGCSWRTRYECRMCGIVCTLGTRVTPCHRPICRMPLRTGVTEFFLLSTREYTREGTKPYRVLGELIL